MAGRRKSINNPYAWSAKQERAAVLLAEGSLTQEMVAIEVGVSRQTVSTWLKQPEYEAHIASVRAEIIERVKQTGIANKESRLLAMNDRYERLRSLIVLRARDTAGEIAGGDTGLLVRQHKMLGSGDGAQMVTEYAADTAVLKAMLDLEKQAAQEMGQFVQRTDLTSGNEPVKAYIAVDIERV